MALRRILIAGVTAAIACGLPSSAPAAANGPTCTPADLDNSALQPGSVTVSPLPGSRDASPQTQISFRGLPPGDLGAVDVRGSRSGRHSGRLQDYSQGDGASFLPSKPFLEGELVTVHATATIGGAAMRLTDEFAVAVPDPISTTPAPTEGRVQQESQHFRSRPGLQPPTVSVTKSSPGLAEGDLLVAPYAGPGQPGPMILDPSGGLLWFHPLPVGVAATDLNVQQYDGSPVLTWWQGDITVHGFGLGQDVIDNEGYSTLATVKAGNGHRVDLHDFQLTPQGTALITSFFPVRCDLSSVGGAADGGIVDGVMQEIDVKTGLVMYEWTSLDHVPITDSYESPASSTAAQPYDFFHINSLNLNPDGSMLISARNTWTVYEIDGRSGQVIWRLGGRRSTFKSSSGVRTAWQHDPRVLPDGSISVFDNGASPKIHAESRGLVIGLDQQDHTATLLSQFTRTPPLSAPSEGNMEALSNGDWLIGWGQEGDFSEFSPAGQMLFDAHLPTFDRSYRDLRHAWTGAPTHAPAFVLERSGNGSAVFASWNGATLGVAWRVLAGRSSSALRPVAQVARSGFETAIPLPAGVSGPYLAVQALDSKGAVLGASAAVPEALLKA